MVVLDISIVNVALPSIQKDLDFSIENLQWVVSAYSLTFGGFLLLGGRAGDLLGRRRVFMVGLTLRFWPEYVELQRRVAAGELGRPLAVQASRLSPPPDWNEWMADASQSGGAAVDLMVHDFDQLNWLLGRPRNVFAREPAPGHVLAVVEYEDAEIGRHWYIHPFLFEVTAPDAIRLDWEATEMRWIRPSELESYETVPRLAEAHASAANGEKVG